MAGDQRARANGTRRRGFLLVVICLVLHGVVGRVDDARAEAMPARDLRTDYARPDAIPFPTDNARSDARVELGRTLFFDPRLSGSGVVSCATCHNPGFSWGDGLARAVGHDHRVLPRRSPTLLNLAWSEVLFWDGRAASLEEQALAPITAPGEMNLSVVELVARIRGIPGYGPLFEAAYPGEPLDEKTVARAIATFERTVVSAPAPFDRFVAGDVTALSPAARRGFDLFAGAANCAKCHSGWRLTDDSFHDVGVAGDDAGRGKIVPGIDVLQFAFKTPTLRDVARRAPYMHDGSEPTLEAVIELYDRGGRVKRPSLSSEIRPLGLTPEQKQDLVAFLESLTSGSAPVAVPTLPR